MGRMGVFVWFLILAMDVVAGILGILAEIAKNNDMRQMKLQESNSEILYCRETNGVITSFGLAAVFLLVVAHIAANLFSACICLSSVEEWEIVSPTRRKIWFACFLLSWIVAAVGFSVLIMGMLQNSRSEGSCKILDYHILLIGGISCFLHGLFCRSMYIIAILSFGNPTSTTTATTTELQRQPQSRINVP